MLGNKWCIRVKVITFKGTQFDPLVGKDLMPGRYLQWLIIIIRWWKYNQDGKRNEATMEIKLTENNLPYNSMKLKKKLKVLSQYQYIKFADHSDSSIFHISSSFSPQPFNGSTYFFSGSFCFVSVTHWTLFFYQFNSSVYWDLIYGSDPDPRFDLIRSVDDLIADPTENSIS